MAGLARSWDAESTIRDRLRGLGRLVLSTRGTDEAPPAKGEVIAKSVANLRVNEQVLAPIMEITALRPQLKLPAIDPLLVEVKDLYDMHKLVVETCIIYQDAWAIRRLAQLVKSRLYKPTPPVKAMCF